MQHVVTVRSSEQCRNSTAETCLQCLDTICSVYWPHTILSLLQCLPLCLSTPVFTSVCIWLCKTLITSLFMISSFTYIKTVAPTHDSVQLELTYSTTSVHWGGLYTLIQFIKSIIYVVVYGRVVCLCTCQNQFPNLWFPPKSTANWTQCNAVYTVHNTPTVIQLNVLVWYGIIMTRCNLYRNSITNIKNSGIRNSKCQAAK